MALYKSMSDCTTLAASHRITTKNLLHYLLSTTGCNVYPHTLTDRYIRTGRGNGKQITYCINSLILQHIHTKHNNIESNQNKYDKSSLGPSNSVNFQVQKAGIYNTFLKTWSMHSPNLSYLTPVLILISY